MSITTTAPVAVDLGSVRITDAFWAPIRDRIARRGVWQQLEQLETDGHLPSLDLSRRPGDPHQPHVFYESDIGKWIEAAAATLSYHPSPALEAAIDAVVEKLAAVQQEDGYLNAYYTVVKPGERFTDLRDAHELYSLGHMIEGAVGYYEATGKTRMLEVVGRYVDLVDTLFSEGGELEGGYDGHEEIELAMVRLARATGDDRHHRLARRLIEARGTEPFFFEGEARRRGTDGFFGELFNNRDHEAQRFREYNQSHAPIRDQHTAVGHSVRALYLYCAMTDLAADLDDPDLTAALVDIWTDLTERKLYVTGGVGADPSIEGFAAPYELPSAEAYAETCASVALVFWAHRMNALTGEARYVEVLERALHNGALVGLGPDADTYFYVNPLESAGGHRRRPWFEVACCPSNVSRLIAGLGRYVYRVDDHEIGVNLYLSNTASLELAGGEVVVSQTVSDDRSQVRVSVDPGAADGPITLALRIPGWGTPRLALNGRPVPLDDLERGYARIRRVWTADDVVTLDWTITPRRVWADTRVEAARGRVALAHGPFVYCLEQVDQAVALDTVSLPRSARIRAVGEGPAPRLLADGLARRRPEGLYHDQPPTEGPVEVVAVPYYSWATREDGAMTVWIPEAAGE